jgi:predicted RNA-binding protein with PUA-like domain
VTPLPLIRNTRLSVMPLTADEWEAVDRLGRRRE